MSVATLLLSPTIIEGTNLTANLRANKALNVALGKIIKFVEFLRGFSAWQLTKLPSSAKPKELTRPLTLMMILTFLMQQKKQDSTSRILAALELAPPALAKLLLAKLTNLTNLSWMTTKSRPDLF
jgi:hypothetical protein